MARNCCGIVSITTGAQILAVWIILRDIDSTGKIFVAPFPDFGEIFTKLAANLLEVIACMLVFFACNLRLEVLMKPIVVLSGVNLAFSVLTFSLTVEGLIYNKTDVPKWFRHLAEIGNVTDTTDVDKTERVISQAMKFFTVTSTVTTGFTVWFLIVFYKCYRHLKNTESNCGKLFPIPKIYMMRNTHTCIAGGTIYERI
ncbi:hypothetical protein PMAYCL1PPCAC_05843 [Pristionchus mayeri]|uniref:Uncharacterized protein n=1 Tax=Pristionchus mayeri TaxID=1317129 RepID=A0AAN4Z747_9BILA|nr:hypothetical protein PMAYCL1PPCAC_05843 [Pristionchus mayeri]